MAKLQAVTAEIHSKKHWNRFPSFKFAAKDTICPLVVKELPKAIQRIPVGFIEVDDRFQLVAVQGLEPGKNLMVGQNSKWRGRYVPEHYRCYPFALARGPDGQQILCIDEDSGLIVDDKTGEESNSSENSDNKGELFFEENGETSQVVNKVLNFLARNASSRDATIQICESLRENELIEPWSIKYQLDNKEQQVQGLFRINEAALNQVPAEALLQLRDNGALSAAYCQLLSMIHLDRLIQLARVKDKPPPTELSFDSFEQGGTLSFDNL